MTTHLKVECTNPIQHACANCPDMRKTEPGTYCYQFIMKKIEERRAQRGFDCATPVTCGDNSPAFLLEMRKKAHGYQMLLVHIKRGEWPAAFDIFQDLYNIEMPISLPAVAPAALISIQTNFGIVNIGRTTKPDDLTIGYKDFRRLISMYSEGSMTAQLVCDVDGAYELAQKMLDSEYYAIDFETTGLQVRKNGFEVVSFQICLPDWSIYYVTMNHGREDALGRVFKHKEQLTEDQFTDIFKKPLEMPNVPKIGAGLGYEIKVGWHMGIDMEGPFYDVLSEAYILNPGSLKNNLKDNAFQELGNVCPHFDDVAKQYDMDYRKVPLKKALIYGSWDVYNPMKLHFLYKKRIEDRGDSSLRLLQQDLALIKPLAHMEYMGIAMDKKKVVELKNKTAPLLVNLETDICNIAGKAFQVSSSEQLSLVLFKDLKIGTPELWHKLELKILKKHNLPSTEAKGIEKLKVHAPHPILDKISEHRGLAKYMSSYLVGIEKHYLDGGTIVYPSYNNNRTASGRLSASKPNVQQIKRGSEYKGCFIPRNKSRVFVDSDWDQLELRIIAQMANVKLLLEGFFRGDDPHQVTGDAIDAWATMEREMRRNRGKTINFAIPYGKGPKSLAWDLRCTVDEARAFLDDINNKYPEIPEMKTATREILYTTGYAATAFDRRRFFKWNQDVGEIFNAAFNHCIQGTGGDLMRIVITELYDAFLDYPEIYSPLTVHDSIVIECPEDDAYWVKEVVKDVMTMEFTAGLGPGILLTCEPEIKRNLLEKGIK